MRFFIAYSIAGLFVALWCHWRFREPTRGAQLVSVLLSLCAWPLFGPLLLLQSNRSVGPRRTGSAQRIEQAMQEARDAVRGTPLQSLLPEEMVSGLLTSLERVERRQRELGALLDRPDFQTGDAQTTSHRDNVERLRHLYQRDQATLQEMVGLAEALRTQLLVARYSGQVDEAASSRLPPTGINELTMDLATRVESLNAWFELDSSVVSADTRARA